MNLAGKLSDIAARAIVTMPSSSGCRITSSTLRGNSGSSSRKSSPLCASGHLARPRHHAAADQPRIRDRVVRRTEGPVRHQTALSVQHTGNRVDLRRLQRLLERQRRQDARQPLRQHRLAAARRPDHQDVVPACRCTSNARLATCCPRTSLKSSGVLRNSFRSSR